MKLIKYSILALTYAIFSFSQILAQDNTLDYWHHKPTIDPAHKGISTERAYTLLKNRTPEKVIVAVIDTGVDYMHEDLDDVMWVNPREIANNGVDDDGNGYIDDIHGWNFLGNAKGENVAGETLEETRIFAGRHKYTGNRETYKKAVQSFYKTRSSIVKSYYNTILYLDDVKYFEKVYVPHPITTEAFSQFEVSDHEAESKKLVLNYLKNNGNSIVDFTSLKKAIEGNIANFKTYVDFYYNPEYNSRELIGDNYNNTKERYYGNNDVKGPNPSHGTHVAGIIAAERNNGLGIDGIANKVKIMAVRVVPDGDEHDKDVANAIYYAIDNGAKVINMSFGKAFSWNKQAVDDAVRYAEKHDVLLVHAAGNSAQELTGENNFPNQLYEKRKFLGKKSPKNWIEVGASTYNYNEDFVASFSNYDSELVDVFAPGFQILSTLPESNYAKFNGTSMASPMAAGVAALLRSYFPKLSAKEVKAIILESATVIDLKVKRPSDKKLVPFKSMSKTGAVLNAEAAVKMTLKNHK